MGSEAARFEAPDGCQRLWLLLLSLSPSGAAGRRSLRRVESEWLWHGMQTAGSASEARTAVQSRHEPHRCRTAAHSTATTHRCGGEERERGSGKTVRNGQRKWDEQRR